VAVIIKKRDQHNIFEVYIEFTLWCLDRLWCIGICALGISQQFFRVSSWQCLEISENEYSEKYQKLSKITIFFFSYFDTYFMSWYIIILYYAWIIIISKYIIKFYYRIEYLTVIHHFIIGTINIFGSEKEWFWLEYLSTYIMVIDTTQNLTYWWNSLKWFLDYF